VTGKPRYSRGPLIAHSVWGAIGFSICVLFAVVPGGHPPLMIFIPLVAAVWFVGHVAIWGAGRIAARGRRAALEAGTEARAWPLGLVAGLALAGIASAIGLLQLVASVLMRELYPFDPPGLWALTMAIWIAHGACFVGLLLRRRWSRYLCAALPLGWAALLAVQIVDHLAHGRPAEPVEMTIAVALVLLLSAFAWYLIASERIKLILSV
jgi:tetrahydromethanopterin S-methyltransferase subunit F